MRALRSRRPDLALLVISAILLPACVQAQTTETYPTFRISGRVAIDHSDQTVETADGTLSDSATEPSSLRLGVNGNLNSRTTYNATFNAASGEINWLEVSATIGITDSADLIVGQTKTTSLGNMVMGRVGMFIDRGVFNDVLGLGRQLAVMGRGHGETWMVSAAILDDTINTPERRERGFSLRGVVTPINQPGNVLHLGVWARQRERDMSYAYSFRDAFDGEYDQSGDGFWATQDSTVALESAWIRGPLTVAAELANVEAQGAAGEGRALRAGYLAAGWMVTGGSRTYDIVNGRYGPPAGMDDLVWGNRGIVELAVRYDRVDLAALAGGGGYSAWMLGANWYLTPGLKLAAAYTDLDDYDPSSDGHVDLAKFQLRAQFDF